MQLIIKICNIIIMLLALIYLNLDRGKIRKLITACFIILLQCGFLIAQDHSKKRILTVADVKNGADQINLLLPQLNKKKVAIVANHTARIGDVHLVDSLLNLSVDIQLVFAPEHGFRGHADAGQHVKDFKDKKTGLAVKSLYGRNKKPSIADLANVDVVVFDIQDVGVRYYTYISTMHYVMEACAEQGKKMIILDRPNPNGFYVDGPVLKKEFSSFVGLHEVPLVHGMTIGEYAMMINGEGWLANGVKCDLEVVQVKGYSHTDYYQVPIKPSPNLPNMAAIYLYPNLGLFEGTKISVGRGTNYPFQIIGAPTLNAGGYSFTPKPTLGAKHPKYNGKLCKGFDLRKFGEKYIYEYDSVYLNWVITAYQNYTPKDKFFLKSGFFDLLAGSDELRKQITSGKSMNEIQDSWKPEVKLFKKMRKKYLLYEDFE